MFREDEHPRASEGKFTDKGAGAGAGEAEKLRKAVSIYSDEPEKDAPAFVDDEDWKNDLDPRGQVDITPGTTKEDYVSHELDVDLQTAERYVRAIDAYADEKYMDIRAYQRGERVNNQQEKRKNFRKT